MRQTAVFGKPARQQEGGSEMSKRRTGVDQYNVYLLSLFVLPSRFDLYFCFLPAVDVTERESFFDASHAMFILSARNSQMLAGLHDMLPLRQTVKTLNGAQTTALSCTSSQSKRQLSDATHGVTKSLIKEKCR